MTRRARVPAGRRAIFWTAHPGKARWPAPRTARTAPSRAAAARWFTSPRRIQVLQPDGALQQQGMDEGLREVAAQLALVDVELLGEKRRRAARGPVAFEVGDGGHVPSQLVGGQRHPEPAEQEGAFRLPER